MPIAGDAHHGRKSDNTEGIRTTLATMSRRVIVAGRAPKSPMETYMISKDSGSNNKQ